MFRKFLTRRKTFFLVALVLAVGFGFFVSTQGRAAVKAAFLVSEFAGEFRLDVPRTLEHITPSPVVTEVSIPLSEGSLPGDLYLPAVSHAKVPAAIFAYGFVEDYHDPRVVKLSTALARSGIAVLVPHFPEFLHERVLESTVPEMVSSFRFLEAQDQIDPHKIGFMGFCVGGSLATVAAEDPAIADRVRFVHLLSPYFDLFSYGSAVFSKEYIKGSTVVSWQPDPEALTVFQNELIALLPTPDQGILRNSLITSSVDSTKYAALSADAKVVWEIFHTYSYAKVQELSAKLSSIYATAWRARSPSGHLAELRAPVFIATGYDNVIPPTESEAFFKALNGKGELTTFDVFSHVSPSRPLSFFGKVTEAFRLWNHIRKTLHAML